MAFVYRYINMKECECVYVGKVTAEAPDLSSPFEPLTRRHTAHKREDWYKQIGGENLALQFITCNPADADIYETWLISFYGKTGQLVNKAKMWGESKLDLYPIIFGRWENYSLRIGKNQTVREFLYRLEETLEKNTEEFRTAVDEELSYFCNRVKEYAKELETAKKMDRFYKQYDFKRSEVGGVKQ